MNENRPVVKIIGKKTEFSNIVAKISSRILERHYTIFNEC